MSKILLLQIVGAADLHPPAFALLALVKHYRSVVRHDDIELVIVCLVFVRIVVLSPIIALNEVP